MNIACLLPARNEAETVATAVREFGDAARARGNVTVFVMNDHSDDQTKLLAEQEGATVLSLTSSRHGLADAFRLGVSVVREQDFDIILHVDADMQYSPQDVGTLLDHVDEESLVVGNRLWRQPEGMSDFRYTWNRQLSHLVGLVAATDVVDGQSGFRAFGRELAHLSMTAEYTYTQEQIVRAARKGFRIVQPPISFVRRLSGSSRLVKSPLSYISRTTADLAMIADELGVDLEGMRFLAQ